MLERTGFNGDYAPAAPLPSFTEFSAYNSPYLKYKTEYIIDNLKIPRKLQHRILLQRVGIPTDRSGMHLPAQIFWENADQIIHEANTSGWLGLGVSTALLTEKGYNFGSPSVRFKKNEDSDSINNKLKNLKKELQNYEQAEGDRFILYHNRWDDKINCMGANIFYLNNPALNESSADENYLIEIQRGVWPRSIGETNTDLVMVSKYPFNFRSNTVKSSGKQDLEFARRLFIKYARNTNIKSSIGELMQTLNVNRLALNFEYYKGLINPLDFNI